MAKRLYTMLECQSSLENFSPFIDLKRTKRYSSDEQSETETSSNAFVGFPVLPEEPNSDNKSVLCQICVRLPDGRRVERCFLKTESVQLLWSFCYSQIGNNDDDDDTVIIKKKRAFKLIQAFGGSCKTLHYGSNTTFQESGLANSVVSVTWV